MAGSDTPQADNADDERMFHCARNEFDLDVSPNAGKSLRQSTSAGHPRLTTGIPVGKPTGMETCGSESLVITGRHGSGFLSGCCEYLPQVLVSLLFIYLI